jgi:hypothetical protein
VSYQRFDNRWHCTLKKEESPKRAMIHLPS